MLGETLRARLIADRAAVLLAGDAPTSACAGGARGATPPSSASPGQPSCDEPSHPTHVPTLSGSLANDESACHVLPAPFVVAGSGAGPHGRHSLVGVHRRGVRSERTMCGSPSDPDERQQPDRL